MPAPRDDLTRRASSPTCALYPRGLPRSGAARVIARVVLNEARRLPPHLPLRPVRRPRCPSAMNTACRPEDAVSAHAARSADRGVPSAPPRCSASAPHLPSGAVKCAPTAVYAPGSARPSRRLVGVPGVPRPSTEGRGYQWRRIHPAPVAAFVPARPRKLTQRAKAALDPRSSIIGWAAADLASQTFGGDHRARRRDRGAAHPESPGPLNQVACDARRTRCSRGRANWLSRPSRSSRGHQCCSVDRGAADRRRGRGSGRLPPSASGSRKKPPLRAVAAKRQAAPRAAGQAPVTHAPAPARGPAGRGIEAAAAGAAAAWHAGGHQCRRLAAIVRRVSTKVDFRCGSRAASARDAWAAEHASNRWRC